MIFESTEGAGPAIPDPIPDATAWRVAGLQPNATGILKPITMMANLLLRIISQITSHILGFN
jgi:hypothetical protein